MKSYKDKILLFILSALLILTLFLVQASLLLRFKMLNPDFYLTKFNDNKIYLYTEKLIRKNIKDNVNTKNIPNEILNNELPKDWVKEQYSNITTGLVDYFKGVRKDIPRIDTAPLLKNYEDNKASLQNNLKTSLNQEQIKEMEKFKGALTYVVSVFPFSSTNYSYISSEAAVYKNIVFPVYYLTFVFILLALFLASFIFYKAPKKGWAGYSFIIAGTTALLPPVLTLLIIKPGNMTLLLDFKNFLSTKPISDVTNIKMFATSVVSELLSYMAIFGGLIILVGIMMISVSSYLDTKQYHFYFHHTPLHSIKSHKKNLKKSKNRKSIKRIQKSNKKKD